MKYQFDAKLQASPRNRRSAVSIVLFFDVEHLAGHWVDVDDHHFLARDQFDCDDRFVILDQRLDLERFAPLDSALGRGDGLCKRDLGRRSTFLTASRFSTSASSFSSTSLIFPLTASTLTSVTDLPVHRKTSNRNDLLPRRRGDINRLPAGNPGLSRFDGFGDVDLGSGQHRPGGSCSAFSSSASSSAQAIPARQTHNNTIMPQRTYRIAYSLWI